jgi:sirohydrochlorin ferrochelatase
VSGTAVRRAYLLVDHGSRREAANAQLEQVAEALRERVDDIVRIAHLELAPPDIGTGIGACAAAGAEEVVVLPYFLAPGRHTTHDIPEQVRSARECHPRLAIRIAAPLGPHQKLVEILLDRAAHAPGD